MAPSGATPPAPFRPGSWLVQAAVFLGVPLLLGLGLLAHFEETAGAAAHQAEVQTLREILTQTAARGDLATAFTTLFDRLATLAWSPRRFARRVQELHRGWPGVFDLFLYDADGKRVAVPGRPTAMQVASQRFLQAVLDARARVPAKIIQGFAGNPQAPDLMRASPGLLVDLLNGDRRTWGGCWTLRDRMGRVTGHFVVFLHRAATTPTATLDRAVARTAALTGSRFQVGWIDPVEPGTLRPPGTSFPASLARLLQELSPGQPVTAFEGRPLVLHLAANGSVLFGLARQAPVPATSYRSWRARLASGAVAVLALGWLLSPLRSLRTRLVLQFLVGGGIPLAVFLATVLIDRDNREHLLVEQFKEAHLESLMRIDQDLSSEYAPLLRRYRQALAALADAPLAEAPRLLRPLAAFARRQRQDRKSVV